VLRCVAINGACNPGVPIHCDDKTDCPGSQVCCGLFDQVKGYQSVECRNSCPAPSGTSSSVRMCDPNAAVDECQAINKSCQQSGSLTGFYRCN